MAQAGMSLNLEGVKEPSLRNAIQGSFNFPSSGLVQADQIDDRDRETLRLTALMRSFGYLDAYMETGHLAPQLSPVPGEIYSLGYVAVEGLWDAGSVGLQAKLRHRTEKYLGSPARSDKFFDLRRDVLQVFRESGFPAPVIASVELRKHALTRLVGVHITVKAGARASFGDVIFTEESALDLVDGAGLAGLSYHPAAIDKLRMALEEANQFSRISLSPQIRTGDPAIVDVEAELQRKSKTQEELASHGLIGLGVLLTACAMIAFRQTRIAAFGKRRHGSGKMIDCLVAVALLTGAAFAVDRVLFLIG